MRDRTVLSKTVHFSWAHAQSVCSSIASVLNSVARWPYIFFANISAKISYIFRCRENFRENWKFSQNFFVFAKSFSKIAYIFRENFLKNKKRRFALNFCENIVFFAKIFAQIFAKIYILTLVGGTWQHWFSMTPSEAVPKNVWNVGTDIVPQLRMDFEERLCGWPKSTKIPAKGPVSCR
jgi:hypothetical protein